MKSLPNNIYFLAKTKICNLMLQHDKIFFHFQAITSSTNVLIFVSLVSNILPVTSRI